MRKGERKRREKEGKRRALVEREDEEGKWMMQEECVEEKR